MAGIAFYNDHDATSYNSMKQYYDDMIKYFSDHNLPVDIKEVDQLEVMEHDNIRCIHFPTSIIWIRFYGTWTDMHDKLATDFPLRYPDVKFYTQSAVPGIII
jgi:hypothetical protein